MEDEVSAGVELFELGQVVLLALDHRVDGRGRLELVAGQELKEQ